MKIHLKIISIILVISSLLAMSACKGEDSSEPVTATITLNNLDTLKDCGNGNLAGIQFLVKFDENALTYSACETNLNDIFTNCAFFAEASPQNPGEVLVIVMDNNLNGIKLAGQTQPVELATLTFAKPDGASGSQNISIEIQSACDSAANSEIESHLNSNIISAKIDK